MMEKMDKKRESGLEAPKDMAKEELIGLKDEIINNQTQEVNVKIDTSDVITHKLIPSNKTALTFDEAKARINKEQKFSSLIEKYKGSTEYAEVFDNIQAALSIFLHNGSNASETKAYNIGNAAEINFATMMTTKIVQTIQIDESNTSNLTSLADNGVMQKFGFDSTISNMSQGLEKTGVMGLLPLVSASKDLKEVMARANLMMQFIRQGRGNIDLSKFTTAQWEMLYDVLATGKFPSQQQLDLIKGHQVPNDVWHQQHLGSLEVSDGAMKFIQKNVKDFSFLNVSDTKKTKELIQATKSGVDSIYETIHSLFGVEKGSELMDNFVKSLSEWLKNPFIGAIANYIGLDIDMLQKTLTGELTASQMQQLETVLQKYKKKEPSPERTARVKALVKDVNSERYKVALRLNPDSLSESLIHAEPNLAVVQSLISKNNDLKTIYLESKKITGNDGKTVTKTVLKPWHTFTTQQKLDLTQKYVKGKYIDTLIKTDTTRTNDNDLVGVAITGWLGGPHRASTAWKSYQGQYGEQTQEVAVAQETITNNDSNVEVVSSQQAQGSFAKLGTKVMANPSLDPYKNSLFMDLDGKDIDMIFTNFVDPKGQYGDTIGKIDTWLMKKATGLGLNGYGRFKEIALYTAIAENAKAIFNYDGSPNVDAGGGYSDNAFQINASNREASIALAKKYYDQAKSTLGIEQAVPEHHFLGQLLTWIGHLMQKEQESKKPFEGLFTLNASDSMDRFTNVIRDNVQIGSQTPGLFKTDQHVRNMMNGRVDQLFDFASSTATVA